jgi:hypothetical protein
MPTNSEDVGLLRKTGSDLPTVNDFFVSFTMCTAGLYRRVPHDRHLSVASSFQIGV